MDFENKLSLILESEPVAGIYGLWYYNSNDEEWDCQFTITASSRKKAIKVFRELLGPELDKKQWKVITTDLYSGGLNLDDPEVHQKIKANLQAHRNFTS